MSAARVPLNFFGMPFGLAGLAEAWLWAADEGHAPVAVGDALCALAGLVWAIVTVLYLRYAAANKGAISRDVTDGIAGPFASLAVITPMLLAADGIAPYAATTGEVLVDVFLVLTVILGAWFTGHWIYGPFELDKLHPGYFLPTVAGGLIASASATAVGQRTLAEMMLGWGMICWLILGSMILSRLFFRPPLPGPLVPTMAIVVAPASVTSIAYFSLTGGRIDAFSAGVAGYGLLMVLAQIRLVPVFLRVSFAPSFWAYTFSWAAVACAAMTWNDYGRPPGYLVYEYLLLAAVTVLIGSIAIRTLVALKRRQLFPAPVTVAPPASADAVLVRH